MIGFVLQHEEMGIYLGNCVGLGFWTKLDPVGQEYAVVFDSEKDIWEHIRTWDGKNDLSRFSVVMIEHAQKGYASIEECKRAGLDGWIP